MASQKQILANRRNSLQSTGPTSVAGKAASSMNAFKTGLRAKSIVIPGENPEDLQQLIDEYYSCHHPATPEARGLVDDLILCEWTLRRLPIVEASLNNYVVAQSYKPVPKPHQAGKVAVQNTKPLAVLQRRVDSTRRGRDRAVLQLHELAAKPLSTPPESPEPAEIVPIDSSTSKEIGFVRSLSPNPPEPPAPEPPANSPANSAAPEASSTVG